MYALILALCGVCRDALILISLEPMSKTWMASKKREDWGDTH